METIAEILELARQYDQELPPLPNLPEPPQGAAVAGWIDHTLLKPDATAEQIRDLCQEAREHHFASVCLNPVYVSLAAGLLQGSPVKVCTVIAFPFGASLPTYKALEALACISAGAHEVDMVMNIGALKGAAYGLVFNDVAAVVQVAHHQGAIVKVILENALLNRQEKIIASLLCKAAGADFIKTSTGFAASGATIEDVELMKRVVGESVQVKAAGGIRDYATARAMIAAGATRLGASAGVRIVREAMEQDER